MIKKLLCVKFGFYIGSVYRIHNSGGSETVSSKISGLIGNLGTRFYAFDAPFDLHASFFQGSGDSSGDSVFDLGLQYTFGF
jgi:hypothetical protein